MNMMKMKNWLERNGDSQFIAVVHWEEGGYDGDSLELKGTEIKELVDLMKVWLTRRTLEHCPSRIDEIDIPEKISKRGLCTIQENNF